MTQKKEELRKTLRSALREKFAFTSPVGIEKLSLAAFQNLMSIPQICSAGGVMIYVEMPREFPITPLIPFLLNEKGRTIFVPWCNGDSLCLFRLVSPDETVHSDQDVKELLEKRLSPGAYGIREPRKELRLLPEFTVEPSQVDLAILPGLGFDSHCRRLGRGKGYYDRFVTDLRRETTLVGVAFDEQILETVPTEAHDRSLQYVVTPTRVFASREFPVG